MDIYKGAMVLPLTFASLIFRDFRGIGETQKLKANTVEALISATWGIQKSGRN